jgi:CheY-like chemotaxis protein
MKKLSSVSLSAVRPVQPKLETVLYVEDEDDNWQIAHLRLGHAYDLVRARNAEEACRIVTEFSSRVEPPASTSSRTGVAAPTAIPTPPARKADLSAILMDIALSGSEFNGVELTEILRGKRAKDRLPEYAKNVPVLTSTPIIFVTAHVSKYSDTMLLRAGGDRVIPKPVDFAALSLALTQLHLARLQQRRT